MNSHEEDTFIDNKEKGKTNMHYAYTSECGTTTLNLQSYFEDLLDEFIDETSIEEFNKLKYRKEE